MLVDTEMLQQAVFGFDVSPVNLNLDETVKLLTTCSIAKMLITNDINEATDYLNKENKLERYNNSQILDVARGLIKMQQN